MLDNLYTFKKNAWHVRLFKWLYGTDPTQTFNTMCPYFWSWIFTILFCWIVIPIRLLGTIGKNFLSKMESFKRDRLEARRLAFITECQKTLTDEEAYRIYKSKCWSDFGYCLDSSLYYLILDKSGDFKQVIKEQKRVKTEKRTKQVHEIKTSKYFPFVAYTVTTVVLSLIVYTFYSVFYSLFTTYTLDFKTLKAAGKVAGWVAFIVGAAYIIFNYIFLPFAKYLKCVKLPKCKLRFLLVPFVFIGKGIVIFCDMIYMTYKKACPRITWKQ